jgi:hypothetical protein
MVNINDLYNGVYMFLEVAFSCRLDLNNPPTAVGGIPSFMRDRELHRTMNKPAFAGLFGSNLWDRIL